MVQQYRYPQPAFGYRARKILMRTAQTYSAQPIQDWRANHILRQQLNNNLYFMRELYRLANRDPYIVQLLLNRSVEYIRVMSVEFKKPEYQQLDPSHPNVINNIYHPLNPSNPQNLQLNPGLNLLVQQDLNIQAAIEENEEEEQVENQLHDMQTHGATAHNINPYHTLGVSPDAEHEEIESAGMKRLAELAPKPHEKPSHLYTEVAAAVGMVGTAEHHHQSKEFFKPEYKEPEGLHFRPEPKA